MKGIISLVLVFGNLMLSAQTFTGGIPFITNYSEKDLKVSTVNYGIIQDNRGLLYFANEYGILEFDGSDWNIVTAVSNHSNIKSLAITKNNRIYAGAQGDFGYVDYQKDNGLVFRSLLDLVPVEYRDFNDVWNIVLHNNEVYFHTWRAIYKYSGDDITVIKTGHKIKGLFKVRDQVLMHDEFGLHRKTNNGFERLSGSTPLSNEELRFILPINENDLLVATLAGGLFLLANHNLQPFHTEPQIDFKSIGLSTGHVRKNGDFVIGTHKAGVYILNNKGSVETQLTKAEGLQNNAIRGLYTDIHNNLWVTHKTGIDMVELSTPLCQIKPNTEEPIGVYSILEHEGYRYYATHEGLLKQSLVSGSDQSFKRVKGSIDINWSLSKWEDIVVLAHAKGFSQLLNGELISIYGGEGCWLIKALPQHPGYFIGGTYQGLVLLKKEGEQLRFVNRIKGFNESSRVVEIADNGEIWVAHGYRGIYRLVLNSSLNAIAQRSFYDHSKGLPSHMFNTVFKLNQALVFGTLVGFYHYDASADSMIMNKELTDWIGYEQGRLVKEDPKGNVWFVSGNKSGVIEKHPDGSQTVTSNPFNKLNEYYIPGFENIYFSDKQKVYIGTKDGVIVYDAALEVNKPANFKCLLRSVKNGSGENVLYDDNIEFLCDTLMGQDIQLLYKEVKNNSLTFSFSAGYYENTKNIRFKYYLQGYDSDWSEWEDIRYKEYTNLKEGDYVFRLKAINIYGAETDDIICRFSILPPWHRTIYAYAGYTVLFISIFYMVMKVRDRRARVEKQRYIEKQERIRKIEQAAYQEEKLRNELQSKNKELAAIAMKTICKNEKLVDLQARIIAIKEDATKQLEQKLCDLLGFIEREISNDDWDDFELRFDLAHNNYIKKLKEEFAALTPHDLKICAYLKMNLSSKEIAQLLNMSVRGVENARYRVRKRLGLDSSVNLTDWLMSR
ncbi:MULTISPECIES: triple tyrosine motif-containing protein [unclassified Carboxylicivirga]|uniref:triple tyrosine motif-containing protein n=1 Tax=Carboxylicivirga TaxID=1628153 RepID=UPI003D328AEF